MSDECRDQRMPDPLRNRTSAVMRAGFEVESCRHSRHQFTDLRLPPQCRFGVDGSEQRAAVGRRRYGQHSANSSSISLDIDQDCRSRRRLRPRKSVEDERDRADVESAGGLGRDQTLRGPRCRQLAGQHDLLLVAARQRADRRRPDRVVRTEKSRSWPHGIGFHPAAGRADPSAVSGAAGPGSQVLGDSDSAAIIALRVAVFGNHPEPGRRALGRGRRRDVVRRRACTGAGRRSAVASGQHRGQLALPVALDARDPDDLTRSARSGRRRSVRRCRRRGSALTPRSSEDDAAGRPPSGIAAPALSAPTPAASTGPSSTPASDHRP